MIDWTQIIIALLGGTTFVGFIGLIIYRKENKKIKNAEVNKETATAMKEDASAAKEMLEVAKDMKDILSDFNKTLKTTIDERDATIAEKDKRIDELERSVRELTYTVNEQKRKIEGMQKIIDKEIGNKKYIEQLICLKEDNMLRKIDLEMINSDKK